jgi:hypothetical protein
MTPNFTQWTKEEFLVYLMLYAANMDGKITAKEQKIICSKVRRTVYEDVLEEFETHSDNVCVQNILGYKEHYLNAADDVKKIIREMTDIFMEDGKISGVEQHILHLTEKLLSHS